MTICTVCDQECNSGYSLPVYEDCIDLNSTGGNAACERCFFLAVGMVSHLKLATLTKADVRTVIRRSPEAETIRAYLAAMRVEQMQRDKAWRSASRLMGLAV